MSIFRDVQGFVREVNQVATFDALHGLLDGMVREFGFYYYAIGHHVTFAKGTLIQVSNYPDAWIEAAHERDFVAQDPVLIACQNSAAAFRWSELAQIINLTDDHKKVLLGAARAGLAEGFTVPINVPGECAGSCSFATKRQRTIRDTVLPGTQYVGCFAFEAARRIVRRPGNKTRIRDLSPVPALTSRQLDCVLLVARGKSDWEIGKLLGIAPETAHQHVEMAKRRYGVPTRTQLVVRALFDNQLGFQDVINR